MTPINIPYVRTPDSRFASLPDFPYTPKYLNYGNLRIAYIDEQTNLNGAPSDTYLCLHGQPTWSYLYRHMIPVLLKYTTKSKTHIPPPNRRVLCPDLLGFGRSDKPTRESDYSFSFHRTALLHFITALNLCNLTLVVQDWGGLLGLTLPLAFPDDSHKIFSRFVVMNTTLAMGQAPSPGFIDWLNFSDRSPDMAVGSMLKRSCRGRLSDEEAAGYDAPFPSVEYKAGVRMFPRLVPIREDMEGVKVSKKAREMFGSSPLWKTEDVVVLCGMKDPVLGPEVMEELRSVWKQGCYYGEIAEAGHFVQEWGADVARMAIEVFESEGPRDINGLKRIKEHKIQSKI